MANSKVWNVLYRATEDSAWKKLRGRKGFWYADPILFKKGTDTFLFTEAFNKKIQKGYLAISRMENEEFSVPQIIMKRPFHLSYSISYYFVIVAVLGMFQYGTREIALVRDNRDRLNQKFSELFFAQVFIGVIVLGAFLFYSIFLSRYPSLFLIELISLVGSSLLLINWLFAGLEEFKLIAIKTMIIRIIGVILIVLLVQTSADLPMYFLIMAAEPLMGALVYMVAPGISQSPCSMRLAQIPMSSIIIRMV